jgi:DNA invertase Pin-like site-specific DNA recombinase
MENFAGQILMLIPKEELDLIKSNQQQIIELLKQAGQATNGGPRYAEYISAEEFMKECNIKRWKFDQLIAGNLIKTLKKKRKIYVPISEISRYFRDSNIQ